MMSHLKADWPVSYVVKGSSLQGTSNSASVWKSVLNVGIVSHIHCSKSRLRGLLKAYGTYLILILSYMPWQLTIFRVKSNSGHDVDGAQSALLEGEKEARDQSSQQKPVGNRDIDTVMPLQCWELFLDHAIHLQYTHYSYPAPQISGPFAGKSSFHFQT